VNFLPIVRARGTIAGGWSDIFGGSRSGTWTTTSGQATPVYTGNAYWPGYSGVVTPEVQYFTFTTDALGAGNWHLNLNIDNIAMTGTLPMSVWVNSGVTILISDTFAVQVDE